MSIPADRVRRSDEAGVSAGRFGHVDRAVAQHHWRVVMGKVVVTEFITLDGVFQDPGGSGEFERGGWSFQFSRGPEGDRFKLDELNAAGAQLLGRVTYQAFASAWPNRKDEQGFADRMNGMPKYVVSSTLEHAGWNNTTIIGTNVPEEVRTLKEQIDGDILVAGSGQLVRALLAHDLVDELHLMVFPIVLGGGEHLFAADGATARLQLVDTIKAGDTIVLIYRPRRDAA
jgi:dihydrofolate reductase